MNDMVKILFIDDDYLFAQDLLDVMKKKGWKVHYQTSLSGCESAIQNWKPDLVLLDMAIDTNENGIDAISSIKMIAPRLPVVIISSYVDALYEARTYRLGGADFIKKPIIDIAAFIERIKSQIPRFQDTIIKLGTLSLDWKLLVMYFPSGEAIKLTSKEMQLLQLLMANKNQVVLYKFIEECLWPDNNLPDTSDYIIHNEMNRLKKYLVKGGITMESIKGKGYILNW